MSEEREEFRDKSKQEKKEDFKKAVSERSYDLFTCFKYSLVMFGAIAVIALIVSGIIGIKDGGFGFKLFISWTFSIGVWISSAGLFLSGIAFVKPKLMGDLTHQKQWRTHFYRMNFIGVMFAVCMYVFVYLIALDYLKVFLYYR